AMSDGMRYTLDMSPLLRMDALTWDNWNLEHIKKHDVTVGEILDVLDSVVDGQASYKGRYRVIGVTRQGRVLTIVVGRNPSHPTIWYVFSAHPASRKERAYFQQQLGSETL